MGETEGWDALLESLTASMVGFTGGKHGEAFLRSPGWQARFRANRRTVIAELSSGQAGPNPRLNDYQLVFLYAVDYTTPDPGRPHTFHKNLTLKEGYQWDEQTLREFVLECLGLFRYVFACDSGSLAFEETSRTVVPNLPRPRLPRRRK